MAEVSTMSPAATWLSVLGAAMVVASGILALVLLLKGSYAQQRIKQLREELNDERETTTSLRARNTDLVGSLDRCAEESRAMKSENAVLRAAPRLAVDKIADLIDEIGVRVDAHATAIINEVRKSHG